MKTRPNPHAVSYEQLLQAAAWDLGYRTALMDLWTACRDMPNLTAIEMSERIDSVLHTMEADARKRYPHG